MLRGIVLKIAATFAFAAMSAIIKSVSVRFPVGEVVLFRSIFAMATLVVWLARRGEFPHALSTRRKLGHIGRSIAGSGGMFANFIALSLLPLADATAFTFATPLLVVPMAAMTLGETVRPYRWAAVGLRLRRRARHAVRRPRPGGAARRRATRSARRWRSPARSARRWR